MKESGKIGNEGKRSVGCCISVREKTQMKGSDLRQDDVRKE